MAASQELRDEPLADGEIALARFAPYLPVLLVVVPFMLGRRWLSRPTILWSGMLGVALPVGLLPLMKLGGAMNNFVPLVVVAPVAALLAGLDYVDGPGSTARYREALTGALVTLSGVYIGLHALQIGPYTPNRDQMHRARALNELVKSLEGGVIIRATRSSLVATTPKASRCSPRATPSSGWRTSLPTCAAISAGSRRAGSS